MRSHRASSLSRFRRTLARAGTGMAFCAFALSAGMVGIADAELRSLSVAPAEPTSCDPVGLTVLGELPDPCHEVIGAEISGPEPLPTLGPIPAYGIRIRIAVREPHPDSASCPTVITPYERAFRLGRLPPGQYFVHAVEWTFPYSRGSEFGAGDSSFLSTSFTVRPDSCHVESCYLLGFAPPPDLEPARLACTIVSRPGGTACVSVTLGNPVPVGGIQTEVLLTTDGRLPVPDGWFEPVRVAASHRADGFDVAWSSEGSTAKILLYSPTGLSIAPGRGPVLHICYRVAGEVPTGSSYLLRFGETIVADAGGEAIPPCPTFAEVTGRICIARPGCDLNGDGISDIRDVVLLVRCILASNANGSACPDSIVALGDCNEDGALDIRDVICCVRRILAERLGMLPVPNPGTPDGSAGAETRMRFLGPVDWYADLEGRAILEIEPGAEFGGAMFRILAYGAPARIRDLRLLNAEDAMALESMVDEWGNAATAMLYPTRLDAALTAPIRVEVSLEPRPGMSEESLLRVDGAASATVTADPLATDASAATAVVSAGPFTAPRLYAPRPNPFATESEIAYAVPAATQVTLRIYDVRGRLVRELENGPRPAGVYRVPWDGKDQKGREVGTGVYFVRFEAGGVDRTARVVRTR